MRPVGPALNIRTGLHEGQLRATVIGRAESLPGPSWMLLLLRDGQARFTGSGMVDTVDGPALLCRPWGAGHGAQLAPGSQAAHIVAGSHAIANAIGHRPESQDVREMLDLGVTTSLEPGSPAYVTVRACFDAIHRESRAGGIAAATLIEAYLRILVVEIWRSQHTEGRATLSRNAPSQRIFNQFTALVELHFRDRWTVERYAGALGLSRDRLGDVCRRIRGRSPKDIIDRRTLREARLLLETSINSAEQIAGLLGFQTGAQFNRFFSRLSGQTPGRARHAVGQDAEGASGREPAHLHDWP